MRSVLALAMLAAALASGCSGPGAPPPAAPVTLVIPSSPAAEGSQAPLVVADPAPSGGDLDGVRGMAGTWGIEDSSAKFHIAFTGGRVSLDGWDSMDGERFEIIDAHVEGRRLLATVRMPSTNFTHSMTLTIIDRNRLHCVRSGNGGKTTFTREDSAVPPEERPDPQVP